MYTHVKRVYVLTHKINKCNYRKNNHRRACTVRKSVVTGELNFSMEKGWREAAAGAGSEAA